MTIDTIYAEICEEYRRKPLDGELKAWEDVLGEYRTSDLDAALRRHRGNTIVDDFTGKMLGDIMPQPAALKSSIERFNAATNGKFQPCGKCEHGWIRVFTGQTFGDESGHKVKVDPKIGAMKQCQCRLDWIAMQPKQLPQKRKK